MFCPKCSSEIPDNSLFCNKCGQRYDQNQQPMPSTNPAIFKCNFCGREFLTQEESFEHQRLCQFNSNNIVKANPQNTSGKGELSEIPVEIKGWSWGGFLWGWVWAIGNKTWIGLLSLIPCIGLIMNVILGIYGREWAWKNKHWDSIEHFKKVQRNWAKWGFIIFSGLAAIYVLSLIVLSIIINPIELTNRAQDATIRNDLSEIMNANYRYYAQHAAYPWDKNGIPGNAYISENLANETWLNTLVTERELQDRVLTKIRISKSHMIFIQKAGEFGETYACFQPQSKTEKKKAKQICSTPGSFTSTQTKLLCVSGKEYECVP